MLFPHDSRELEDVQPFMPQLMILAKSMPLDYPLACLDDFVTRSKHISSCIFQALPDWADLALLVYSDSCPTLGRLALAARGPSAWQQPPAAKTGRRLYRALYHPNASHLSDTLKH